MELGLFFLQSSNASQIKTYVGTDGKIHFTNSAGADTVLNFSVNKSKSYKLNLENVGNGGSVVSSTASLYDLSTGALIASVFLQTAPKNTAGQSNYTTGTWA